LLYTLEVYPRREVKALSSPSKVDKLVLIGGELNTKSFCLL
jgi:hypothetical protein